MINISHFLPNLLAAGKAGRGVDFFSPSVVYAGKSTFSHTPHLQPSAACASVWVTFFQAPSRVLMSCCHYLFFLRFSLTLLIPFFVTRKKQIPLHRTYYDCRGSSKLVICMQRSQQSSTCKCKGWKSPLYRSLMTARDCRFGTPHRATQSSSLKGNSDREGWN